MNREHRYARVSHLAPGDERVCQFCGARARKVYGTGDHAVVVCSLPCALAHDLEDLEPSPLEVMAERAVRLEAYFRSMDVSPSDAATTCAFLVGDIAGRSSQAVDFDGLMDAFRTIAREAYDVQCAAQGRVPK